MDDQNFSFELDPISLTSYPGSAIKQRTAYPSNFVRLSHFQYIEDRPNPIPLVKQYRLNGDELHWLRCQFLLQICNFILPQLTDRDLTLRSAQRCVIFKVHRLMLLHFDLDLAAANARFEQLKDTLVAVGSKTFEDILRCFAESAYNPNESIWTTLCNCARQATGREIQTLTINRKASKPSALWTNPNNGQNRLSNSVAGASTSVSASASAPFYVPLERKRSPTAHLSAVVPKQPKSDYSVFPLKASWAEIQEQYDDLSRDASSFGRGKALVSVVAAQPSSVKPKSAKTSKSGHDSDPGKRSSKSPVSSKFDRHRSSSKSSSRSASDSDQDSQKSAQTAGSDRSTAPELKNILLKLAAFEEPIKTLCESLAGSVDRVATAVESVVTMSQKVSAAATVIADFGDRCEYATKKLDRLDETLRSTYDSVASLSSVSADKLTGGSDPMRTTLDAVACTAETTLNLMRDFELKMDSISAKFANLSVSESSPEDHDDTSGMEPLVIVESQESFPVQIRSDGAVYPSVSTDAAVAAESVADGPNDSTELDDSDSVATVNEQIDVVQVDTDSGDESYTSTESRQPPISEASWDLSTM